MSRRVRLEGVSFTDVWHTPGGGVDDVKLAKELFEKKDYDNEYFHQELKREMMEELGVEITNIKCIVPQYRSKVREAETLNKYNELVHYYFLEYLCNYIDGDLKASDDLVEAKWVQKSELYKVNHTPPSQEMYRELGWCKSNPISGVTL